MDSDGQCPYLGTVRREVLDFDLPHQCSQTLQTHNVYICLVCGVFLQGRGALTPAHTHSLQVRHYLFMHLSTGKCYCLPEMYEVQDGTLSDIQFNRNPEFGLEEIRELVRNPPVCRSLAGTQFVPGTVGLNNLKASDYINVVLQVLFTIREVQEALILVREAQGLTAALGDLFRRMINPKSFKSHVAPYQAVKAIERLSKTFTATQQGDPQALWTWLLNRLLAESILKPHIKLCFQGKLTKNGLFTPFLYPPFSHIPCDLPPMPVFQSSNSDIPIPTIDLNQLLSDFAATKGYQIHKSGRYLVIHFKRFGENRFYKEKNATVVRFPVRKLEARELGLEGCWDLVTAVAYEGDVKAGRYKAFVYREAGDKYYEMADLQVSEVLPQVLPLSEVCQLIYRRSPPC